MSVVKAGLAGVLFDMDGTLVDSEPLWEAALDALAAHLGGTVSDHARQAMVGTPAAETMSIFYADLGISDPDLATDRQFLADRMVDLYASDATWRPGAAGLVAQVREAHVPAALVTSTARRLVEVAIEALLGWDTFDVVVCGDEVAAPKPDPEAYRTAADRLGVPVDQCVAIEDSPAGLASARAAGAVTVGVPGVVPLAPADGVHLVPSLTGVGLPDLARLVDGAA